MREYFLVGTYTEPILFGTGQVFEGKGRGIYACAFEDGEITVLGETPLRNPSFFCVDEARRRVYAVNELKEYGGAFGGGVTELRYDGSLHLQAVRSYGTGGADPCHAALSPEGGFLAVSNFASGSVSIFPVGEDGGLLPRSQLLQHHGGSVHPVRQRGPHAHSAVFSGGAMLVPDLGLDKLVFYRWEGGVVSEDGALTRRLRPGSGPRFGEFSPDGRHFYLINEIASSVTHFLWDGGALTERETVSTLPEGFAGDNICSDLHLSPDGAVLYASNRGHDSIAAYAVEGDGSLALLERVPCGGRTPRNFTLSPDGRFVLVGNQESDTIAVFSVEGDGRLRLLGTTSFPSPVCLRFFRPSTGGK